MQSLRVLVVDDVVQVRELLRTMLLDLGCTEVDRATDGIQAIDKCSAGHYSLIFLDIDMPRMNGLECLREIKRLSSSTRVIMISGMPTAVNVQKSVKAGADAFIAKPYTLGTIRETIKHVV